MKGHTLIIGQTESGKSTLAHSLSEYYGRQDIARVVLDPDGDPRWSCETMFKDIDAFMDHVQDPDACLSAALFIDEGGSALDKFEKRTEWLTTRSRHHGHVCHIITQRAQQINATTRSQCSVLWCFNIAPKDAKIYADDFNCPELVSEAPNLPQGHYIRVKRFAPLVRGRLW